MNDDLRYELISAYLDGELSPAERVEVEQLLADDAAARRLCDELRALSQTLQALPRHQAGEALADQVLRQAERKMLTEKRETPREPLRLPFGRDLRSWTWAALAVAAAVLIMIFNPRDQAPEVAHEVAYEAAPAKAPEHAKAASRSAESQLNSLDAAPSDDAVLADKAGADRDVFASKAPAKSAPPAEKSKFGAEREMPAAPETAPLIAKQAVPMAGKAAGGFAADELQDGAAKKEDAEPAFDAQLAELADEGVLVVQIDMSQAAAARGAWEQLLTSQAIQLDPEAAPPAEEAPAGEESERDAASQELAAAQPQFGAQGRRKDAAAESEVQMVYVEAPPATVEATLADLAARPQDFPAIEVEPAPAAKRQQAYAVYGRGQTQQSLKLRNFQQAEGGQSFRSFAAPGASPTPTAEGAAGGLQAHAPAAAAPASAPAPPNLGQSGPNTLTFNERPFNVGRAQRVQAPYEVRQNQFADADARARRIGAAQPQRVEPKSANTAGEKGAETNQPAGEPIVVQNQASSAPAPSPTAVEQLGEAMRVLFVLRILPEPAAAESEPADAAREP